MINDLYMSKKHKCSKFNATEEYFLKGDLINNILYIKNTGDSDGIENIRCIECEKEINSIYKIEIC